MKTSPAFEASRLDLPAEKGVETDRFDRAGTAIGVEQHLSGLVGRNPDIGRTARSFRARTSTRPERRRARDRRRAAPRKAVRLPRQSRPPEAPAGQPGPATGRCSHGRAWLPLRQAASRATRDATRPTARARSRPRRESALFLRAVSQFGRNGLHVAGDRRNRQDRGGTGRKNLGEMVVRGRGLDQQQVDDDAMPRRRPRGAGSRWRAPRASAPSGRSTSRLASSIATISTLSGGGRGPRIRKRRSMRVSSNAPSGGSWGRWRRPTTHEPGRKSSPPRARRAPSAGSLPAEAQRRSRRRRSDPRPSEPPAPWTPRARSLRLRLRRGAPWPPLGRRRRRRCRSGRTRRSRSARHIPRARRSSGPTRWRAASAPRSSSRSGSAHRSRRCRAGAEARRSSDGPAAPISPSSSTSIPAPRVRTRPSSHRISRRAPGPVAMALASSESRPTFRSDHRPETCARAGAPWIAETEQARTSCAAPSATPNIQRRVADGKRRREKPSPASGVSCSPPSPAGSPLSHLGRPRASVC